MTRFDAFANRRIIGLRYNGTRPWQIDFLIGPWRPFSYRRGIRKAGRHYLDLGRLGVLRWGRLGTVTITPDTRAFTSTMHDAATRVQEHQ